MKTKNLHCESCGKNVDRSKAVLRSRRLTDVLAWCNPTCYGKDHPPVVATQRVPSQFS